MFGRPVLVRGPAVVVFLRHLGPGRTRAVASALDRAFDELDRAGVITVAVVGGALRSARDGVPRLQLRFPVVHDDGTIADAWGVGRSWAAAALGRGDRLAAGFVVAPDGRVAAAWTGRTMLDAPDVAALARTALRWR